MAGLNTLATIRALESHCAATGLFGNVNTHEPKNAPPGGGLTAAIWSASVVPLAEESGLASTSVLSTFTIRIYSKAFQGPEDMIDPTIVAAVDTLLTALSADYTLGGNVREIDLLGNSGAPLSATAGYVTVDSTVFRTEDINVPCVIEDAWTQAP